jgi:hypothetical protein
MDAAQAFSDWMSSGGVWVLVVLPLCSFVAVLVHELGHAVFGLSASEGLVHIRVGRHPGWLRGRVGRLAFNVSPIGRRGEPGGMARTFAQLSARKSLAYALCGPAASLLLALCIVPLLPVTHGLARVCLIELGVVSLLLGVTNLVPRSRGPHASDGLSALRAVRRLRAGEVRPLVESRSAEEFRARFERTEARWYALFTDNRHPARTDPRAKQLAEGVSRLSRQPEPLSPEWSSLFRLAFAGWCWREVEGTGPADEAQRQGFLNRAFRTVHLRLGIPADVPQERCRSSFLHGIAVHDAETRLRNA